ncbi:hypothetical protein FisN_2Lh572 [Fistulifera solaris]|uniref:Uncharacterized protein n=1 Tax=Fistulifera solaris TaxID=1519565 RepID=A0A1Z5K9G0_FISSO|nr:hypothetical protein FisN_2Lh572 [Fistulifera solaris]|eukprot:GAX22751.1 hypothetical protein FisN_2Lh572 [Fistulifera solaris]
MSPSVDRLLSLVHYLFDEPEEPRQQEAARRSHYHCKSQASLSEEKEIKQSINMRWPIFLSALFGLIGVSLASRQPNLSNTSDLDEGRKAELRGSRRLLRTDDNKAFHLFHERNEDGSIHDDADRDLFIRRICGDVERLFTSQYTCDCSADGLPLQISYSCERMSPSQVGRAAYGTRYEGSFVIRLLETQISSPVSVCLTDVTYQAVRLGEAGRFVPFGNFCIEGTLTIDVDPLQGQVSASVADCNVQFGDIGTCTSCQRCPTSENGFYLDCPSMPGPLCLSNNIPFFGSTVQTNDRDVFDALGLTQMMESRVDEMLAEEDATATEEIIRSPQQQETAQQPTTGGSTTGNTVQSTTWSNTQGLQNPAPNTGHSKWLEYASANKPATPQSNSQINMNNGNRDIPWWVMLTTKGGNR